LDGVTEVASGSGEWFGFERTREVGGKSGRGIAEVAKAWGKKEDITVLRGRGSSPWALVRGTLGQVSTWIDGGPSCVPESREHAHALAGACAVMGAAALRAAMKELERLATAGTAAAWTDSLARPRQTALETERGCGTLPGGLRPPRTAEPNPRRAPLTPWYTCPSEVTT